MNFRLLPILSLFLFFSSSQVLAQDKAKIPNNKFGIHLAVPSEEDLQSAADLVNSSGGDWGYVTLVMTEKDRDRQKWQHLFNQMRGFHLIPIVRLATSFENKSWRRPNSQEAREWADFLGSLNWVVKNRYLVLFNEPNRGDEWGGKVDTQGYGQVVFAFAKKLKEKNPDFFLMLAGFDAAAPDEPPRFEDEENFLKQMFASLSPQKDEISNYLDGWASHSYPDHGFTGSPWGQGRNSVKTYLWERNLLKELGFKKELPVFITETGWPHAEGKNFDRAFGSQVQIAQTFRFYFDQIIDDSSVKAITPFVLNYQGAPFDHFSWQKLGSGQGFYSQYQTIRDLPKSKGDPDQEQKLAIVTKLPQKLITGSTYQIPITIRNDGQAIWDQKDGYQLKLVSQEGKFEYLFSDFSDLKPFEEETVMFDLKTANNLGKFELGIGVAKNDKPVSNKYHWAVEILPAIKISFKVDLFPKIRSSGNDFKLILYNQKEEPVFERRNAQLTNGQGKIEEIKNLAIGEKYRVVILKKYYLPRQTFLTLKEEGNIIQFKHMLPFDFKPDGKFSLEDGLVLIQNPDLFRLLWPQ